MNEAVKMLMESDMEITDIAEFFHYNYAHFRKMFKKHFGITPYMYRRNATKTDPKGSISDEKEEH